MVLVEEKYRATYCETMLTYKQLFIFPVKFGSLDRIGAYKNQCFISDIPTYLPKKGGTLVGKCLSK